MVATFAFFSCENEEEGLNYFDLGIECEFEINEEYLSTDEHLQFSIFEINDSRCPNGVMCIWAGEVSVNIAIAKPAIDTITLGTNGISTAKSNTYEFQIIDVSPYPDIQKQIAKEDYIFLLKVTK